MTRLQRQEMWFADEIEEVRSCPVCALECNSEADFVDLRDYLENVPGSWQASRCDGCGCVFLTRRPVMEAIAKAYASYYTHGDARAAHESDNGASFLWRLANGYLNDRFNAQRAPASRWGKRIISLLPPLRQQLDFYFRHLPRKAGSLLDVGCGNAVFLLRAKQAGWRVAGVDMDERACDAALKAGLPVRLGRIEDLVDGEVFDVVTASHVLEHVYSPERFLRQIFCRLKPGGSVWIATPNAQSLGLRRFKSHWRGLEPPRHIVVLSRRAVEKSLIAAGFADIRFHCRGRGASYMLKASRHIAEMAGRRVPWLSVWLVDLLASCSPSVGEELVVTARRPD